MVGHASTSPRHHARLLHATPRGVERFLREARITAELQHENLIDILDMGLWGGTPYLVLDIFGSGLHPAYI